MDSTKPYLTFSHPGAGPIAFLFKKAAEQNARLLRTATVEEHRDAVQHLAEVRQIAPGIHTVPVNCDGVPCEWISHADSPPEKALLYLHGGSWAYGNLYTARAVGKMLCWVSGYRVLVVQYRLIPEHPFPAGLDDCITAYRWMQKRGFSPNNIALFGDSAGGNLSLALMHHLHEQGIRLPAALGLASPATDLTEQGILARNKPDLLYMQHEGREQDALSLYCGAENRLNPLISPMYGDLSKLPPMLIHVGQDEDLCVECDLFAQRAYSAGADVALKIWRGMYHDFTIVGAALKESRESLHEFGRFFQQHLH